MAQIQTSTAAAISDRRFDRSSWLALAIGLAILALGLAVTAASYAMPADGWLVNRGEWGRYTEPIYTLSLPGANPALKPGDVLLEVDGIAFARLEAQAATLQPLRPANWEFGRAVQYTLARGDSVVVVPVTLQRPPLALTYRLHNLVLNPSALISLIFLPMGVLLLWLRPRQRPAQLLFVFSLAYWVDDIVSWGAGSPAGVADLFSPATYWPRIFLGNLLWFLVILPLLCHLFLIFPSPKRIVQRHTRLIPLIYVMAWLGCLVYVLLSVAGFFISGIGYAFIAVTPFLFIITSSLLHSLVTIKEPVPRRQIRWVAFGGLIGIVGPVIISLLGSISVGSLPAPSNEPAAIGISLGYLLVSLALPVSLAVAVLRYRLWDIEIIINRSLVYGTLTAALGLMYFATVVSLQALFRALTGQGSPIAVALSTLVIAGLFSPLRRHVQRFIDRRLYRRKYDAARILGRFATTVRDEPDLDRLTTELRQVVGRTMQAEHVSIWLRP